MAAVTLTDASSTGLKSCLQEDVIQIAFASRTLTDCEARYMQIEQEMFAIIFAREKFAHIYGQLDTL